MFVCRLGIRYLFAGVRVAVVYFNPDVPQVFQYARFFDIAPLLDRPVGNLSGGEKSRVVLARAESIRPSPVAEAFIQWVEQERGAVALHEQVDQLIAAKAQAAKQPLAGPADDGEFLRRAWFDFAGTIPSAEETRKFLADKSPDKRAKLLERLTTSPKFAEQLAEAFNIQLMERNGDSDEWRKYLTASFRANKPWDQMAREILGPDFKDEQLRGAGFFATRRLDKVGQQDTDYPGLTRDVGRLFMGVDLQCCQCHKHLTVKDYKQVDFNGLFFPIQNLKMQAASGDYKTPWVLEGLVTNKYEFVSVLSNVKGATGPRVPLGAEVEIPAFTTKEELWSVPPDPKTRRGEIGRAHV